MEIGKTVQESDRKIASGFCALRDKSGNWICHTILMDSNKQTVLDKDLAFRPCREIQADLKAKDNIVMPYENQTYVLNTNRVKIESLSQEQHDAINLARENNREHGLIK